MAGLSALDEYSQNHYGVFPLCGKIINPVSKKAIKVWKNKIVKDLTTILGLKLEKEDKKKPGTLTAFSSLRYGHIMIMADQDHDGSHIKGLLINLIYKVWPSLLKEPDFLCLFITPTVKVTPKDKDKVSIIS
jgi:DNA topoisomerase II